MKNVDLLWILILLLVTSCIIYYKDDISQLLDDNRVSYSVNEEDNNYKTDSIVSYSSNEQMKKDKKAFITGENLYFNEEYNIYYTYLSSEGKKIYNQVYANALVYNKTFTTVTKISTNELSDVMEALFNDHPELFYLDTNYSYKYNSNGMCIEITLNYNDTVNNIEYNKDVFEKEVNRIVNEANKLANDFEKEKYVYMALINEVDYDKSANYNQSAFSALVVGKSVCAGYARAFQLIMQRLNIPTYYVLGFAKEEHAWNIVKLNGGYYNVDLTWDDTGGVYKHFNLTDRDIAVTHERRGISKNLPKCNYRMG